MHSSDANRIDIPRLIASIFWWIFAIVVWEETVRDRIKAKKVISALIFVFIPVALGVPIYFGSSFILESLNSVVGTLLIGSIMLTSLLAGLYVHYWALAKNEYYKTMLYILMPIFYSLAASLIVSPGGV
ncbi:hypothetical protein ACFL1A_02805 [Patescibacteria group bacterium]